MNRRPALIIHPDVDFCHQVERFLSDLKCDVEIGVDSTPDPERINGSDYRLAVVHEETGGSMCDGR